MAEYACVEPAIDRNLSVRTVRGNDTLVFPHVDSCMSVTIFVPPDLLIGGHAGMMSPTTFEMCADQNLTEILQRMFEAAGAKPVTRAVFVGNDQLNAGPGENWQVAQHMALIRHWARNPHLSCPLINTCNTPRGVDVFFDNGPCRLRVQNYVFDRTRGDTAPPTRQPYAHDVPYHAIRDHTIA